MTSAARLYQDECLLGVYSKLNMKVKNLENKIPDATTFDHINQYNTDKQSLRGKNGYDDKKYLMLMV